MTNPEQDRKIMIGVSHAEARTEAFVDRLLAMPTDASEFREIGYVTSDGIAEHIEGTEPATWPTEKSFTIPMTMTEEAATTFAAFLPPEWSLGVVESTYACRVCGAGLPVVADIRSVEKRPGEEVWTCPVRNADELRAHQVEHDPDADVDSLLSLTITVKR